MAVNRSIRYIASSHHDARPPHTAIDLIVLHAISLPAGEFSMQHVEALFTGRLDSAAHPTFESLDGLRVAAHFVVDRAGSITQFVPVEARAWHAGESVWQGRKGCNDYAIGIEILGDEEHPFTRLQYRETARLCSALKLRYPGITNERIVGHQDIAPGRKWDPGKQWSWPNFHRSLAHIRHTDLGIR